jgi:hypothetical protein
MGLSPWPANDRKDLNLINAPAGPDVVIVPRGFEEVKPIVNVIADRGVNRTITITETVYSWNAPEKWFAFACQPKNEAKPVTFEGYEQVFGIRRYLISATLVDPKGDQVLEIQQGFALAAGLFKMPGGGWLRAGRAWINNQLGKLAADEKTKLTGLHVDASPWRYAYRVLYWKRAGETLRQDTDGGVYTPDQEARFSNLTELEKIITDAKFPYLGIDRND